MTEQKTYSVDNPDLFLNRFYEAYRLFVYNEAWKYCDKLPNVEDLVQEVWLRLCRKGEQLATYSKKQQCAYIAVVVRNTAISMTQENVETVLLDDMGDVAYDGDAAMIGFLDKKITLTQFREAWPLVPEKERNLLERKYILLESDAEIAKAIGISKNSVRMALSRARKVAMEVLRSKSYFEHF